jgi:hypothetical protein
MITEDEYLERVVAGIQRATSDGVDVQWNETINGRQFDVVVRFTLASLRYLVLFEVKNRKRKAEAQDLDAFVTKSRDHGANKAVFVNVAGFQSGAVEVARKHGVEIFTVAFDKTVAELPVRASYLRIESLEAPPSEPTFSLSDPTEALNVSDIELHFTNGKSYSFPDEPSQANYYLTKTTFPNGQTLGDYLSYLGYVKVQAGEERLEIKKVAPAKRIVPPDDYFFPAGKLKMIKCKLRLVEARVMTGNTRIDPTSFRHPVVYKNVLTDEELVFTLDQLPLGDKDVQPGSFFMLLHPLRYYHCDDVEGGMISWTMVESFQNAILVQLEFTQKIDFAPYYIPVRDKQIIARLEKRLQKLKA